MRNQTVNFITGLLVGIFIGLTPLFVGLFTKYKLWSSQVVLWDVWKGDILVIKGTALGEQVLKRQEPPEWWKGLTQLVGDSVDPDRPDEFRFVGESPIRNKLFSSGGRYVCGYYGKAMTILNGVWLAVKMKEMDAEAEGKEPDLTEEKDLVRKLLQLLRAGQIREMEKLFQKYMSKNI